MRITNLQQSKSPEGLPSWLNDIPDFVSGLVYPILIIFAQGFHHPDFDDSTPNCKAAAWPLL